MEQEDTRSQAIKSNRIKEYLVNSQVQVFTELCALREQGWQSEEAERHFARQRTTADTSSTSRRVQHGFYKKMLEIADEINQATGVFAAPSSQRKRVLDICMAPGAFTDFALRQSAWCEVDAITLAPEQGGHDVLLHAGRRNANIWYTDITLHQGFLPAGTTIPANFPDRAAFSTNAPLPNLGRYDLVVCDGQRLRTHEHAERRAWEPGRLLVSQLILGLTHVKPGGSMLILLHRAEQWNTVSLIYRFSQFSDIQLFKPVAAHATRSSFYLLARNIRPEMAAPLREHLKVCWYKMTFYGEAGLGMPIDCAEDLAVENVLAVFGPRLIEHGYDVWRKQRDALNSSRWIKGSSSRS